MNIGLMSRQTRTSAWYRGTKGRRLGGTVMDRVGGLIGRPIRVFCEGIAEGRRLSRLYDTLAAMSNDELARLHISRSDIPTVVAGTDRDAGRVSAAVASGGRRERPSSSARWIQPLHQGVFHDKHRIRIERPSTRRAQPYARTAARNDF
jgi:hypothetical protein